jgi:hypothetical protein
MEPLLKGGRIKKQNRKSKGGEYLEPNEIEEALSNEEKSSEEEPPQESEENPEEEPQEESQEEPEESRLPEVVPKEVNPTVVIEKPAINTPFISNTKRDVYRKKLQEEGKIPPDEENEKNEKNEKVVKPRRGEREQKPRVRYQGGPSYPIQMPPENAPFQISATGIPNITPSFEIKAWNPEPPELRIKDRRAMEQFFAPTSATSEGPREVIPIQKIYNITLPGPTGGHVEMNKIYEIYLPGKNIKLTFITLGERLKMLDFFRQILIKVNDGEDIGLAGNDCRSILSYVKLLELNPNYYSPIYSNPYKGLPYGLIIYRVGFPIRFHPQSQTTICAPDCIGLNLRLYALNIAEYCSYLRNDRIYKDYDVWRELAYYEYVREEILKRKRCPNFVGLYAFFLCRNYKIDFFKLKSNLLTQKDYKTLDFKRFQNRYYHNNQNVLNRQALMIKIETALKANPNTDINVLLGEELKEHNIEITDDDGEIITIEKLNKPLCPDEINQRCSTQRYLPHELNVNLQAYSGTTLAVVTEAPNQNLFQWGQRKYEQKGIVHVMTDNGYHDEDVWYSILFQITAALYVMQIDGLYLKDMTVEDNVYIKDLPVMGQGNFFGYWRYIVDGIPYYVPNYGYLVMIDSNFKDIIPGRSLNMKREYKFYSHNVIGDSYPLDVLREQIWQNYRNIVNTNIFGKVNTFNCVNKPPESILKFMSEIMTDPQHDLGVVLFRHFGMFMNNRIGTYLRPDSEVPNLRQQQTNLRRGELVAEVLADEVYRWGVYVGSKGDMIEILTKERQVPYKLDTAFVVREIRKESIKQYPPTLEVTQDYTGDKSNFNENNLLETYYIDKNVILKL